MKTVAVGQWSHGPRAGAAQGPPVRPNTPREQVNEGGTLCSLGSICTTTAEQVTTSRAVPAAASASPALSWGHPLPFGHSLGDGVSPRDAPTAILCDLWNMRALSLPKAATATQIRVHTEGCAQKAQPLWHQNRSPENPVRCKPMFLPIGGKACADGPPRGECHGVGKQLPRQMCACVCARPVLCADALLAVHTHARKLSPSMKESEMIYETNSVTPKPAT